MMGLDDIQHADVSGEAMDIARAGGDPYVFALGEMVALVDMLFDGPGIPHYFGASKCVDDLFFEAADFIGIKIFTRQFWGPDGRSSVVAAMGLKGDRPALLAVVPVELALAGAWMLKYVDANGAAIALACDRSLQM